MTKKVARHKRFFGFLAGRKFLAGVFLVLFLLGYNLTLSVVQQCSAVPTIPVGAAPPPTPVPPPLIPAVVVPAVCVGNPFSGCSETPCEIPGATMEATTVLLLALKANLTAASQLLEDWVYQYVHAILLAEYAQIDWLERSMISWWDTMWYYNLLPSFQEMTRQLNVGLALQTQQLYANADATAMIETARTYAKHEIEDQENLRAGEQVCVAATQIGGFARATSFFRPMRQAWETKSVAAGLNQKTDPHGEPYPGAAAASGSAQKRYDDWKNIFCDARGNSIPDAAGNSVNTLRCGQDVDKNLINADVLPVKYLFNNLTINVDDTTAAQNGSTEGKNLELAVEYLINNLVGLPMMDAMVPTALSSPAGKHLYLTRRSYLARYASVRSVPDMVAGWRMPGSQMGKWLADLRESGGIPASLLQDTNNGSGIVLAGGISKNPSYKEIMHTLSIDRFNSGMYATEMLTDPAKVDIEKLNTSVFYLMQLRDYYELLERTALTLAVQVSILAEEQDMAVPVSAAPMAPSPGG